MSPIRAAVPIDTSWPGARSVPPPVVLEHPSDAEAVSAYASTVNPSLLRRLARHYRDKYSFGTFQWVWVVGECTIATRARRRDASGLAWIPDGGFGSVMNDWRSNCLDWPLRQCRAAFSNRSHQRLRATPSARSGAEDELVRLSGVMRGWRNHQFSLTRRSPTGPVLQFSLDEVHDVLTAICTIYGWCVPEMPDRHRVVEGPWRSGGSAPAGWPGIANQGRVVSLAVTGTGQVCWTEPGGLIEALSRVPTP
jgi:hypothetical protein